MGGDGENDFSQDAFGYSLHYNTNDYKAIGGSSSEAFLSAVSSGTVTNLYNGNISRMATAITENVTGGDALNLGTQVRDFKYDELNRLISSNKVSGKGNDNAYATAYNYDANGNIKRLTRNDGNAEGMDDLKYHYIKDGAGNLISNRLLHVNDDVLGNELKDDIKDQRRDYAQNNPNTHNYKYDKIGNLIADEQEEIAEIKWNVQGKVQEIKRTANSTKSDLLFKYDAMGNRISKTEIYPKAIKDVKEITTYYVRDAQGNVMAVYSEQKYEDGKIDLSLTEQHLYGSSRLGMRQVNELLVEKDEIKEFEPEYSSRSLGEKSYELSNHLGNVLAVVSDKKKADGTADVKAVYDYYPFGMQMPGRSLSGDYRYGFTGMEIDGEINNSRSIYTTEFRLYDSRLGRWFSIDPKFLYQQWYTPFGGMNGNPIVFNDPNGDIVWGQILKWVAKRAIPLFFGGAAISTGTQFVGNLMYYDDVEKAVNNIDVFDAALDGTINVVTGGAGSIRLLFKEGTRVAIRKAYTVTVLELVAATTDLSFEGWETLFNGDKDVFEATSSFVLSLAGDYTAEQITGIFKRWALEDKIPSNFAPRNAEEKERILKINELVNSESFQTIIESGVSTIGEYVESVLSSDVKMEVKKIGTKSFINDKTPSDNTDIKVNLPIEPIQTEN
jgi:RHS repeat-associated protein